VRPLHFLAGLSEVKSPGGIVGLWYARLAAALLCSVGRGSGAWRDVGPTSLRARREVAWRDTGPTMLSRYVGSAGGSMHSDFSPKFEQSIPGVSCVRPLPLAGLSEARWPGGICWALVCSDASSIARGDACNQSSLSTSSRSQPSLACVLFAGLGKVSLPGGICWADFCSGAH